MCNLHDINSSVLFASKDIMMVIVCPNKKRTFLAE